MSKMFPVFIMHNIRASVKHSNHFWWCSWWSLQFSHGIKCSTGTMQTRAVIFMLLPLPVYPKVTVSITGSETACSLLHIYPHTDVLSMLTYYLWVCTGLMNCCVRLFSHWLHPEAFRLPGHRLPCSHSQQWHGLSVVQEGQQIQNPQRFVCVYVRNTFP